MAGFIPGILYGAALAVTGFWMTKGEAILTTKKASKAEIWVAFKDSLWGIMMPVIILGGIYGGFFSPTEAAAVSCVYGLFVGVFIYKKLGLRDIYELMRDSISSTGDIMLIIACASLFAWFCSTSGITSYAIKAIQTFATNKYMFLALVNVILLIAGCFMDSTSAIYIFCPIIMPVARALKYDPVAMGVVFIVNLAIGNVTPPVGVNTFVACAVARITIKDICKKIGPLLIASVAILLLLTYVPEISLFLPKLLLR
jgi:C4-dicarboxylate transporter DctM subunit